MPTKESCNNNKPRLAAFTYLAAGKRLHLREANGHLLVRTGGGYEELMSVLAKLPLSAAACPEGRSSSTGGIHSSGGRQSGGSGGLLSSSRRRSSSDVRRSSISFGGMLATAHEAPIGVEGRCEGLVGTGCEEHCEEPPMVTLAAAVFNDEGHAAVTW